MFLTESGVVTINTILRMFILALIRGYQYVISPVLSPGCRFYPSCSHYAYEAVSRYGALKGLFLSFKRLLKCHPFHPGGVDPIP